MKHLRAFTLYEVIIALIISGIVINLSITILSLFQSLYKKETSYNLDEFYLESNFIHDLNLAETVYVNQDTSYIQIQSPLHTNNYTIYLNKYIVKNNRDTFYIKPTYLKSRLWFLSQNKIHSTHVSKFK